MGAQFKWSSLDYSASLEDENITSLVVGPYLLQLVLAAARNLRGTAWRWRSPSATLVACTTRLPRWCWQSLPTVPLQNKFVFERGDANLPQFSPLKTQPITFSPRPGAYPWSSLPPTTWTTVNYRRRPGCRCSGQNSAQVEWQLHFTVHHILSFVNLCSDCEANVPCCWGVRCTAPSWSRDTSCYARDIASARDWLSLRDAHREEKQLWDGSWVSFNSAAQSVDF